MAGFLKAIKKGSKGKHKVYGKNKDKCQRYFNSGKYVEHKLKKWLKNNAGKDWPKDKAEKEKAVFLDMEYSKQRMRGVHLE